MVGCGIIITSLFPLAVYDNGLDIRSAIYLTNVFGKYKRKITTRWKT